MCTTFNKKKPTVDTPKQRLKRQQAIDFIEPLTTANTFWLSVFKSNWAVKSFKLEFESKMFSACSSESN